MTDQAAQSKDQINPRDVRYVVQADFHMASENRPQRNFSDAWRCAKEAMDRGATEIRIRPYKQEGVEAALPEGASSPRSTSDSPPSPTPVQGDLIEAALRDALKRMLNVFDTPLSEGGMTAGAEQETCAFARAALANAATPVQGIDRVIEAGEIAGYMFIRQQAEGILRAALLQEGSAQEHIAAIVEGYTDILSEATARKVASRIAAIALPRGK